MLRVRNLFRSLLSRAATGSRRKPTTLHLAQLEPRENPVIPAGLTDVPQLILGAAPPSGYTEMHAVLRNETNTVTVDQAGTGSSGTFTIDVVGSAASGDTASGSGADAGDGGGESGSGSMPGDPLSNLNSLSIEIGGGESVTATGTASNSFMYHLVISGTYAAGVFTVTGETYTETGTNFTSQNTTWTNPNPSTSSFEWDDTISGNYTLSWSASLQSGVLTYTSYSYTSTETGHWHERTEYATGGFSDSTWDSQSCISTTGSGTTAGYSGSVSWQESDQWSYPDPNDPAAPPQNGSSQSGYTNPLSGSTDLPVLSVPTEGWTWLAGTPNAINFTYHGVSTESASLTESAVWRIPESLEAELT